MLPWKKPKQKKPQPVLLALILLLTLAEENTRVKCNQEVLGYCKIQIMISYGIILSQPGSYFLLGKNNTFCFFKTPNLFISIELIAN